MRPTAVFVVLGIMILAGAPLAAGPRAGLWSARLEGAGDDIPFRMCLGPGTGRDMAVIQNGEETLRFPVVRADGESLVVDLDPYPGALHAAVSEDGSRLDGTWKRHFWVGRWVEMPFHAEWQPVALTGCFPPQDARRIESWDDVPRFEPAYPVDAPATTVSVAGRWAVQFADENFPSVGVFEQKPSGVVTGSFLTTTGDYRFLEGTFEGRELQLSTFDASHAYLFLARLRDDGTLDGSFWSYGRWKQEWTARRDPAAQLPDALAQSRWNPSVKLADIVYPDVDGRARSPADAEFAGRVRLLALMGSWCPNCGDATMHLLELERSYRDRGLAVIGISFEMSRDFDADAAQVRRYVRKYAIPYPVLVAPMAMRIADSFPGLSPLYAIPSFVFVDRNGTARHVFSGYSGPATGDEHFRLREQFDRLVEQLLAGGN